LVDRDAPAARCTAAMPPRPHDVASVANAKRRSRSFNRGSNPSSRDFIARNASSSGTAAEYVGGHNSTDRHAGNSTVSNIHSIGLVITLRLLGCTGQRCTAARTPTSAPESAAGNGRYRAATSVTGGGAAI